MSVLSVSTGCQTGSETSDDYKSIVIGMVPELPKHPELPAYYACCDAYITASLSDTCSISMLEGMAMHLPVLSLKDELNEGQVVDGVNGYNFTKT